MIFNLASCLVRLRVLLLECFVASYPSMLLPSALSLTSHGLLLSQDTSDGCILSSRPRNLDHCGEIINM